MYIGLNRITRLLSVFLFGWAVLSPFRALATDTLNIDGSTGVKPLVQALAKVYGQSEQAVPIEIGSGLKPKARIQALLEGEIDIAMASHGIDVEQITRQGLKVHKIAKVAVVMAVNHDVNVGSISDQQLCDIYAGRVINWRELGGSNRLISKFIRPFNEVDTEVVSAHIPCFSELQIAQGVQTKKKSGQMAKSLAQTSGAIGMTTMVRVAQSDNKIVALALNGTEPSTANLASGQYRLSRDLFLITASQPSAAVMSFLAFIRTESGTDIIRANNAAPAS